MARPFPFDDTNEPDEEELENSFDSEERWYEQLHDMQKDDQLWDN